MSDLDLSYLLAEEAVGPEEEKNQKDEKRNSILPLGGYLPDPEVLGKGEQKAAEGRSGDAADAADNHRDNSHHQRIHAHCRRHVDVKRDQDGGDPSEHGAQHKGKENGPVGIQAGDNGQFRVGGYRPHRCPHLRVFH